MIFQPFPKLSRLSRECVITEKIDGTNAQVCIYASYDNDPEAIMTFADEQDGVLTPLPQQMVHVKAGSRTRWLSLTADNFGFAAWVKANARDLIRLGVGCHFGEWWGKGVQRGYGLSERRFSLFNTGRWNAENVPACCSVVPVLFTGEFTTEQVSTQIERLRSLGSVAAPGFMDPEGVVVYHTASGTMFKKTLKNDAQPKSLVA